MVHVRFGLILLGLAALGSNLALSDELPPNAPDPGSVWGNAEPAPAAPAEPPAPPAPPSKMGTNGLPKAFEAGPCPDLVSNIDYRLKVLRGEGYKRMGKPYAPPNWVKEHYREVKQKLAEYSREHLERDFPVWTLDEFVPQHAESAVRKMLGTLQVDLPVPLDSGTAITHIDQLIKDTLEYPKKLQAMRDQKGQAVIAIDELNQALKTPEAQRTQMVWIPKIENGDVVMRLDEKGQKVPVFLPEPVQKNWQIKSKLDDYKKQIKVLDGNFGVEGSFTNLAEQQAANLKLLKITRDIFDRELLTVKSHNPDAPIPKDLQDKYKDIAQILDSDRSHKDLKVLPDYMPPHEAMDRIKLVEMRKDNQDLFFTFFKNVNERRLKVAIKDKYGDWVKPSTPWYKQMFGASGRNSPSTPTAAQGQDGTTQTPKIDINYVTNFLSNLDPNLVTAARVNKLNGYVALFRQTSFGAITTLTGAFAYNALHNGVMLQDAVAYVADVYVQLKNNQKEGCASNVEPFSYSLCRTNYLKSHFLKSYIEEMGVNDDAVSTHRGNKQVDIDIAAISTKPTRGNVYKDPKTGLVYFRPEYSPRYFQDQPGARRDDKFPTLRINPKELPELGSGFPIERDSKKNQIVVHADTFVKRSGFLVFNRDGSVDIAPHIRKEASDLDKMHLTKVAEAYDEANLNLLLQRNANLGDPCSEDSKAQWLKADEKLYQTKLAQCIDEKFNIFVSRSPIAETLNQAVVADSAHKRALIDKLVVANDNFGNCVCTMFQQREAALDATTKVDYKCGTCIDPSTITTYGLGLSTGAYPAGIPGAGGSTWPVGNGGTIPWGGNPVPANGGYVSTTPDGTWQAGGWPPAGSTTGTGTTTAGPGGYVVLPVGNVPVRNPGGGNTGGTTTPGQTQAPGTPTTQTHPGSFQIPSLTGPVTNTTPPPFFLY